MRTVTYREVADSLARVIAANPDRQVEACRYSAEPDNDPLCVVGEVLFDLGLPRPLFGDEDNSTRFKSLASRWFRKFGVEFDPDAVSLLYGAQKIQDTQGHGSGTARLGHPGNPWIEIVRQLGSFTEHTVIDSISF